MALLSRHPKMTVLCFVLMLIAGVVSMGMLLSQATDPILQIHAGSLTTYLPASATNVQDIRPLVGHRGVNIEGSLRAAPGFALAIQGNPFENEWRGGPGMNGPVNLAMGTFREFEVDLSLPAPGFRWNVGRSYNHRQRTSADAHRDSDGYQGVNWFQTSQPEIVLHEDGQDPDDDVLYLVYGADRFIEFSRVDLAEGTSDTFLAVNGAAGVVVYEEGEPDTYTYFDQHGNEVTFFGFGYYAYHAKGQIWKMTDPAGNVAYVGDETTGSTAISSGYNVNGGIAIAYDTAGRRYTYTYTTLDSVERLTRVKAEEDDGGWVERARVEYTYYSDQDHGDPGDLKLVEVTTPLSDSNVDLTQKKYYRYFEGSYDAQSNPGYPHAIKMVLDFEGTRNFDWDGQTFDEDFLAVEDEYLRAHATIALEYDQDHRARKTIIRGGCCGMSDGTYEYEYESSANYSNNVLGYDTEWCTRTIVKRPDGSYHTQYFDEVAQPLASVITGADPDTNPTARWATDVVRGNVGEIRAVYTPACTTAYNHTTGAITKSSTDGLQWIPNRSTSGDTKNFVVNRKFRKGSSGTQYYDGAWTYGTASITPSSADADVVRPFVATRRVYPDLETTDTGYNQWSYTTSVYSRTLAVETVTETQPAVSTGKNGSNSSVETEANYNADGTLAFQKSGTGAITYREYVNGQLTKLIQDADTTKTGSGQDFENVSIPSGFSSSGSPFHMKTIWTHDDQGRQLTMTPPDGMTQRWYYSQLGDERPVTLHYPKYTTDPLFYGPADGAVTNHAGKTEASFLVAVSGGSTGSAQANHVDETDDDPITAMDLGTVSRLVVNLYSEEGTQLESSWRYFDVPTSGAGTEGTHYDETLYGYDDSGRPTRVKEPSGTITRTEYDLHGHVIERHVGTNDSLFDGGEPSGTDNMVKTEELVYDDIDDNGVGDPGGNGLLSLRTLFVQDGTSGQRETKFTYDLKGNLLLQKNPVSPHAFLKVDNLGRTVAAGLFSSTDDIVVGTDDPVQEADNRVGLMQRFFDERGDLWKAQVHKIDPSSGSNLDNLVTEYWRDADGRLTKTDGSQLAKTRYDTLGRVTHEFTLATTNDTGYADADDVTGDVVLEERQAAFDPTTGRLFMTATIERNHDDASTTGALDANGDGDWLKYTMDSSNVKGRIQIVGLWYDADRGRLQDRVEVGTNEGNLFNRGAMSNPPNRSISRLRYTYAYNEDGTLGTVIDSDSHVALYEHDDAGRLTKEARNYDANVNGGAPSGTDDNVTVTYAYLDGLLRSRTADVPGSNDQETLYIYGTTEGTPAASKVSTGHLLRAIKYADSTNPAEDADDIDGVGGSDSDIVSFAYNAQGEGVYRKDQAGNVLQVDLDGAGRPAAVKATAIAEDFDSSVQRIDWAYDDMGRIRTLTQYDSTSGQTAVDQERFSYDGWGLPALVEYDRDGLVGEQGSVNDYDIAYLNEKATDGRNALRRTEMTLPSGRDITYAYSTANYDEDASRVTQVKMDETVLAAYDYIGASRVAETTYDEIDIYSSAWAGTSGEYDGWDELTRPKKNRWTKELGQNDVHVFFTDVSMSSCCGAGTSEDTVLDHHDVKYENDGLGRRTLEHEGTLVDGAMTNTSRKHEATLDHLANWVAAKLDKNGDGDCLDLDIGEYDDDRAFNLANELTGIDRDDDSAFDDVVPAFDPNGNMTDDGEWHEYVYDAFNRLVQIKNTATQALEVELKYSGRGLLVGRHGDVDGGTVTENDPWYHLVYDAEGQQAATFRASDTSPKEEFVPHDAGLGGFGGGWNDRRIILRDRDGGNDDWTSQASGQFSERIYYCQDPQKNVVALIDGDGKMVEWVKYSVPFGLPWGDVDSDGDRDGDDADAADAIFDASGYDVRADTNLDGQVTAADVGAIAGSPEVHLGYGKISDCMSLRATAGLPLLLVDGAVYLGPAGALSLDLGRLNCRAADRECGFSRYRLGLVLSCFTYPPPDDVPAMTWHDITEPYRDVLEKLLEVLQSYMDARRDQMLTNPPTCTVSVYCGGIPFLEMVGIVHCWVTVKHCDGGNQRYEKWQWDNPDMAPEGKQLGSKDSNVFMNRTGESDDAMSDGVGGDVELVHKEDFDCIANEKENTWEDPPACQKLTPDVVGTYSAADWYFLFGPNSNTFAQSLIYFVGIDYQLPAGAVGRGNFGTFNFDG